MKKKALLTVLTIGIIIGIHAQNSTITLIFTADNNGQHVPLNSILVENLTQGGDTLLYAPDTSLILDYISGINKNEIVEIPFSLSQNYPNPFTDQTSVNLNVQVHDYLNITIRDVLGREIIGFKTAFQPGNHKFTFYPGSERYYLLSVTGNQSNQTIKMLSTGVSNAKETNCRLVYNEMDRPGKYKMQKSNFGFIFNLGDELKYTAYADLGERSLIDTPLNNQTYTFQYHGNPCPESPTVVDVDGNIYPTTLIGTQCWMAENLKTTRYQNETLIPNVTGDGEWSNLTSGAYVWYDNDITWKDSYGALYNWFAAIDTYGLCPEGWHVPSNDEWTILTDFIGGTGSPYGNELKSCRQVNSPLGGDCSTAAHPRWAQHNANYGTDDYWFSGLPGGTRNYFGSFVTLGYMGSFWSSSEGSSTYGALRGLNYNDGEIQVFGFYKQNGYSVRCLRSN